MSDPRTRWRADLAVLGAARYHRRPHEAARGLTVTARELQAWHGVTDAED